MPEGPADADLTDKYLEDFFGVTPALGRRMETRAKARKAEREKAQTEQQQPHAKTAHLDSGPPYIDPAWFVRPSGFDASRTIHGIGHTRRVWIHAQALAEILGFEAWEREALHFAALWHDIGRTHDGADYYHGAKSAGRAIGLGLHEGLDDLVRETALFAVTHHCGSEEHALRAVGHLAESEQSWRVFLALKDADGLDRVRLGDLDPSYLHFPESEKRIGIAWELLAESPE